MLWPEAPAFTNVDLLIVALVSPVLTIVLVIVFLLIIRLVERRA